MKIDGSCHCGSITYEAELEPDAVGICHCTDCQALSASVFRTLGVVKAGAFHLLTGFPKIYIKTGDSGNRREQAFCDNCGSAIYSASVGDEPKAHNIRMGTVRQRAQFEPEFQLWCRSAQPWLPTIDTPRKSDRQ
ncbi:GFA family protein [Pseudomonadota bacterium]